MLRAEQGLSIVDDLRVLLNRALQWARSPERGFRRLGGADLITDVAELAKSFGNAGKTKVLATSATGSCFSN